MFDLNTYFEDPANHTGNKYIARFKKIQCASGLSLSVQAHYGAYCTPSGDVGPYTRVEVGYPSQMVPELMEWCENPSIPTETVYGQVPVEVVEAIVDKHGGVVKPPAPLVPDDEISMVADAFRAMTQEATKESSVSLFDQAGELVDQSTIELYEQIENLATAYFRRKVCDKVPEEELVIVSTGLRNLIAKIREDARVFDRRGGRVRQF
jgi:hypothetical protein